MTRARVVVVGGGLSGLATAWRLRDEADVVVLEATERLGGQIHTTTIAGTPMDVGADAFLARQPAGEALVRDAGLGDDLVAPVERRVLLWRGDTLRPLPEGTIFGVPADLRAVARSRALTPSGLLRAALEPAIPRRFVPGDRSVADLVGERFGREVVDVLVEPLLGGVYAGRADDLSAEATLPPVWEAARTHRSLAAGLAARATSTASAEPDRAMFLTLRGGLSGLIDRLRNDLGDRVRKTSPVTGLRSEADGRWSVEVAGKPGTTYTADHVVLAVPAGIAARVLGPVVPEAARELAAVRTASVAVVALAYDLPDSAGVPDASGVLVPRTQRRLTKAITLSSRKWPHLADAPRFLVRASVGRIDDRAALDLGDDELAERVDGEVRWAIGIRAPAIERHVVRWDAALPQYDVGHRQRVERLRHALEATGPSGLHVAGAALDGVGLSARCAEAQVLAEHIVAAGAVSSRRTVDRVETRGTTATRSSASSPGRGGGR